MDGFFVAKVYMLIYGLKLSLHVLIMSYSPIKLAILEGSFEFYPVMRLG